MKYRIQIQQVFGGNWANFEEASQHAEWLEMDNIKPRSRAAAMETLEAQVDLYKSGAPHRVVAYSADGTFEVLYTLLRGTPWFATKAQQHPTLADCAAKFEDEPLYECEIPSAPGRDTLGSKHFERLSPLLECGADSNAHKAAVNAPAELPPGTYTAALNSMTIVDGRLDAKMTILGVDHAATIGGDVSVGFSTRLYKCKPVKGHRPKTYKQHALGIDSSKVMLAERVSSIDMAYGFDRQGARLCRIEQELVRYVGKRCTPHRDRKVAKLRKILRILKRGLYE